MEKLKAKHDHKLTDILKVAIFGLILILPGIMFLPSCMYYAVNKYATPPTSQVENTTQIKMQQNVINGKPLPYQNHQPQNIDFDNISDNEYDDALKVYFYGEDTGNVFFDLGGEFNLNDKILFKANLVGNVNYFSITISLDDLVYFYEDTTLNNYEIITEVGSEGFENILRFDITNFSDTEEYIDFNNVQIFNLTEIFGSGNEPSIANFNTLYPNVYYDYGNTYYADIPNGTYTTYTDIPKEIDLQWQSLWNKPILKWTNTTILKEGLDNFTNVFGITQNSYITNLIAYELIMVAIYIVIDIVLTLFKWLTHLIGEK